MHTPAIFHSDWHGIGLKNKNLIFQADEDSSCINVTTENFHVKLRSVTVNKLL